MHEVLQLLYIFVHLQYRNSATDITLAQSCYILQAYSVLNDTPSCTLPKGPLSYPISLWERYSLQPTKILQLLSN